MAKRQALSVSSYSKVRTQERPVKEEGKKGERTQTMETKLALCVGSLEKIVTRSIFFRKVKPVERRHKEF